MELQNLSSDKLLKLIKNEKSVSEITKILYELRNRNSEEAAIALQECMTNSSVLIDHEIAYILGQMRMSVSIPFLKSVAEDTSCDCIVRHEAIEALGNFEDLSLIDYLQIYLDSKIDIINESAVLSIKKLQETNHATHMLSKYHSRDPAFPFEGGFQEAIYMFKHGSIEDKYKALFYFRDLNTPEAVNALGEGFKLSSELLRHEIAYVFGQMQNPLSVGFLCDVLEDEDEKDIVRHEAAEALGNIGDERSIDCLRKFLNSDIRIIQESAKVGLGIFEENIEGHDNLVID